MFSDVTLGTDLVDIRRVERAYERFGFRFFERLLTDQEWAYCLPTSEGSFKEAGVSKGFERRRFLRRAASRIAAKEAVAKALEVGIRGLSQAGTVGWKEIEVQTALPRQGPKVRLYGAAEHLALEKGIREWRLSLTHDGDTAMACVIGLV